MSIASIFDLELKGKFISIFSDKHSYYIIFLNDEDRQAYVIITNKYFETEGLYDILNSSILFECDKIIFTKPINDIFNEFIFKGFLRRNNKYYSFSIENYKLVVEEKEIEYNDVTRGIESLKDFDISHFIQKRNYIYFTGYDRKTDEDVFVIFDLTKNRIKYLNNFYSDDDFIILNHFCIDENNNNNIVICGYKETIEKENIPFLIYFNNPIK